MPITHVATTTFNTESVGTGGTLTKPAGIVAGDFLLAVIQITQDDTAATAAGVTGFTTQVALTAASGTTPRMAICYKIATGSEPASYTLTKTGGMASGNSAIVTLSAFRGVDQTTPFLVAPSVATPAAANPVTANSISPTLPGGTDGTALVCVFATHLSGTTGTGVWTTPSGMTTIADLRGNWECRAVDWQWLTASGATGAKSSTLTGTPQTQCRTYSMALRSAITTTTVSSSDAGSGADASSVAASASLSDSGAGAEDLALTEARWTADSGSGADATALLRSSSVADSGSGAEALAVTAIEYKTSTDAGSGTDSFVPLVPVLKAASDTGTGVDTVSGQATAPVPDTGVGAEALGLARSSALTDSGSGTDPVTVLRASSVADAASGVEVLGLVRGSNVDDGGLGDETIEILRFSELADSGAGDEATSGGPFVLEQGVGVDEFRIVDIPYTAPVLLRQGAVYDLVVVARIPQVSGPPTLLEVDGIEWSKLQITDTLSAPQKLVGDCLAASVPESVLQRVRSPARLATELWLYRNGKLRFAGPMRGWQTSKEKITFTAMGLLDYLRQMVVDSDKRFDQADQFDMAKWMVDQWQALEYGHYGIDTSSVGASGRLRDGTYLASELHQVLKRATELGQRADGFDLEVDPASRKLQLWYPGKGVDRSTGEDAIVLDARNITNGDITCSVSPDDVASEGYGASGSAGSDNVLISRRSNPELRAAFGRSAVTQSWYDISEQTTLDAHTQGLIDARSDALLVPGPKLRVTPDADLDAYGEGDTVAYTLSDQIGLTGAFRIRSRTVDVASTGQEMATCEFV